MKAAACRTLGWALLLSALAGAGAAAARATPGDAHGVTRCAPAPNPAGPVKPSSFAPRARAHNNVYGVPIQAPILKRRAKPKPHPPSEPPQ